MDGSANYVDLSTTYDSATGIFSGTMTANACPAHSTMRAATGSCTTQTFPDTAFAGGNKGAPLLGAVGYSLKGVNIYGALDAGFTDGQICATTDGANDCTAGTDLHTCIQEANAQCAGTAVMNEGKFLDDCGGHASPYHYHYDLTCDYTVANGHAPLIGLALDGRGIYGANEDTGTAATTDFCNGHTAMVPANADHNVTATSVYHYHTSTTPPYTLGCFGPVETQEACEALYTSCATPTTLSLRTDSGVESVSYAVWCTCYKGEKDTNTSDDSDSATSDTNMVIASAFAAFLALF